jgi:pSer/pThr/pTyr-binding forkhead associated (FHA) protein
MRSPIVPPRPAPPEPTTAPEPPPSLPAGVERSVYGLYLLVERGRDQGAVFPLNRDVTVIGRSQTDVVLNDPDISRRHAAIDVQGRGNYVLRDLRSTNGTLLNGRKVNSDMIADNDKVRLGGTTVKFLVGEDRVLAELARFQEA